MASEVTSEMTRIYVGGLGERVTKDDVINTFSKLGRVESVEFVNTKGRSFGYINFYPSSQNALAKLLSMYNGCMWKGGKLKLEKAKEHYVDRMKREWEEDAKAASIPQNDRVLDEDVVGPPKPNCTLDLDKAQIRMYFPKLRKVKSLPLRGTGKHKYSFQRVEVPPLPRHFCDCPEHSIPDDTRAKVSGNSMKKRGFDRNYRSDLRSIEFPVREQLEDSMIQDDGMNEEEISVMNSVMKKILDREASKVEAGRKDSLRQNASASRVPVVENEAENGAADSSDGDDDDIKINVSSKIERMGRHELPQKNLPSSGFPVDMNEVEDETEENDDDENDDIKNNVTSKIGQIGRHELLQKHSPASGYPVDVNQVEDETAEEDDDDDIKINVTSKKVESPGHHDLLQQSAHAFGSSTKAKGISDDDQDDDDDDIEINVISGQNEGSHSESWELKTSFDSQRIKSNELDLHTQSDSQTQVRKRKSLDDENDDKKLASPRSKKKACVTSNNKSSSESEEHEGVDTSSESEELEEVDTSSESEEHEGVVTSSESEEHEGVDTSSDSEQHEEIDTLSESEEHGVENDVNENPDDKSTKSSDNDLVFTSQPDKPRPEPEKSMKGSSWMQKGSWTQLIGGGNSSSLFSISQTLPSNQVEKHNQKNQSGSNRAIFGNPRGSSGQNNAARDGGDISNKMTLDTKSDSKQKPTLPFRSYPISGSSDSCPFMRNADSLKEWTSAKTALSSALKRRNNKA